jgi:hypothetical protein
VVPLTQSSSFAASLLQPHAKSDRAMAPGWI